MSLTAAVAQTQTAIRHARSLFAVDPLPTTAPQRSAANLTRGVDSQISGAAQLTTMSPTPVPPPPVTGDPIKITPKPTPPTVIDASPHDNSGEPGFPKCDTVQHLKYLGEVLAGGTLFGASIPVDLASLGLIGTPGLIGGAWTAGDGVDNLRRCK